MIYLDHHSTTPCDPRVVEAMLPWFTIRFANASSAVHGPGLEAAEAVEAARASIAATLGAAAREVIFTSGATESNNLALLGMAEHLAARGRHAVAPASEHSSVLDALQELARVGWEVTLLPVTPGGWIAPEAFAAALRPDTTMAAVMHVNNETGVLNPVTELAAICAARGVALHCDATQSVGKIDVDVRAMGVTTLAFSAHKFHGPKGVGGLFLRSRAPRARVEPRQFGGGQERGLRSGTLNVPGIVGMARALELATAERAAGEGARIAALRDRLRELLLAIPGCQENGDPARRLGNSLNVRFEGVDARALMNALPEVAMSPGAACSSANPEPSHVLRAMGLDDDAIAGAVRLGLGRWTTLAEVETAAARIREEVLRLRGLVAAG